jgi:hypothetical protein
MSLTCGGRGPCCHVGYAHRHCEHCDTVIALSVQPHAHYPWYQTYPWYGGNISGITGLSGTLGGQLSMLNSGAQQQQLMQATEVPIDHAR